MFNDVDIGVPLLNKFCYYTVVKFYIFFYSSALD